MPLSFLTLLASRLKNVRLGSSRKSRWKYCQLEVLEQRWVLATYNWTGAAADSNWITPGNWDSGGVPQTVNYPGSPATVGSGDIAQFDSAGGSSGSFTTAQIANIPSGTTITVAEVEIKSTAAVTIAGVNSLSSILQLEGTGTNPGTLQIDSITTNGTTTISALISAPNGLNDTNISRGAVSITSTINASSVTITNELLVAGTGSTFSGPITATGAINIISPSVDLAPYTITGNISAPGGLNISMNGAPTTANVTLSSLISAPQGINAVINDGIIVLNNLGSTINGGDTTYTVGSGGTLAGGPNAPAQFGSGATVVLLNGSTFKSNNTAGESLTNNFIIGSSTFNSGNASVTFLNGGINLNVSTVTLNGNDTILLTTTSATFNGTLLGANAAGNSLTLNGTTAGFLSELTFAGSNPLTLRGSNSYTLSSLDGAPMLTANTPTVILNAISGPGPLTVMGTSPLTLAGKGTFTGGTSIQGGELLIDSTVSVSGGIMVNSDSTLGGIGTTGAITAPGGTVIPGDPSIGNGIGILTATSADFTNSGTLQVQVAGYATAGTSYSQLNLGTLGSSTLNLDSTSALMLNLAGDSFGGTTLPGPGIIVEGGILLNGSSGGSFTNVNVINNNTQNSSTATVDYSVPNEVNVDVASAPVITSASFTTFTVNSSSTFTVTAPGFPAATFTEAGSLPSGVTLSTNGVLSGTPAPGTATTYNDIITATNSNGSATQGFALTVNAIATTTTLTDLGGGGAGAATLSFAGSSVTFTTAVNASSSVAGDTVTLRDASNGNASVGSGTLTSGGAATVTVSGLAIGSHSIFAVYNGDATFAASQSNTIVQVVQQTGLTNTSIVDLGPNPSLFDGSVTFTTAVAAGVQSSVAGDTVTLEDASNGNVSIGSSTLSSGGTATITVSNLAVGSHSIFAVYPGDMSNSRSQSTSVTQVVQNSTTTTLTDNGPNPSLLNEGVSYAVTITGGGTLNGESVALVDASNGDATVGTGAISSGSATISGSFSTTGTHNVFALYNGDALDAGSQSSSVAQTVVAITSSVAALPATETNNSFNVLWAGIDAASGTPTITYTIMVSDNFAPYTTFVTTTATSAVFPGQNNHTYSFYSLASDNLGNMQTTPTGTATTTVHSVPVTTLTVTSFTPTPTGFSATFSKPFLNTTSNPIHLYSAIASNANYGPADVTLVGRNTGPVTGSLVVNATNTGFTFIKTNLATGGGTGGLLAPDSYTVTFLSGPLAFQDTGGGLLDGNSSGLGGTNYTNTFAVSPPPPAAVTVSIPDFARGPDNTDSINLVNVQPNPLTGGIPVTFNIPVGDAVTSGSVTVQYNPSLLTVSGAFTNSTLSNATLGLDTASTAGTAILDFNSSTALPTGNVVLGDLIAFVPASAPYRSKQLLQISSAINGGAIPSINDNAVQVVAFFGNTSGTGAYSSLDSGLLLNVSSGADAGFANFPTLDPAILGDLNDDGVVDSGDAVALNTRNAVGSNPAFVPPYPGAPSNIQAGPDPTLSIPSVLSANADGTVLVPVNIDDATPTGSTGMQVAQLALRYDPTLFTVSSQDVQLGSVPNSGTGWQLHAIVDQATGEIGITLASRTPIEGSLGGSLVTIALQEKSTATPGATPVELVASVTPNGQAFTTSVDDAHGPFTLTPAPSNSESAPGLVGTVSLPGASVAVMTPSQVSVGSTEGPVSTVFADVSSVVPDSAFTTKSVETSLAGSVEIGVRAGVLESAETAPPVAELASAVLPLLPTNPVEAASLSGNGFTMLLLSVIFGQGKLLGENEVSQASGLTPAGRQVPSGGAPSAVDQVFQIRSEFNPVGQALQGPSIERAAADKDSLRNPDLLLTSEDNVAADLAILDGCFAQVAETEALDSE